MAKKKLMKWLLTTLGILGIVGGLVHVLQAYNTYNLLALFGSWSNIVQLLAGLATIVFIGYTIWKK